MKKTYILLCLSLILISSAFASYQVSPKNENTVKTMVNKVKQSKLNNKQIVDLINKLEILRDSKYKGTKSEDIINDLISGLINYNTYSKETSAYDVTEVVDGDTVKIDYNGIEKSIRILGIDTPEKYATRTGYKECYGEEASNFAKQELTGKRISIEFDLSQDQEDKYGRLLAHVFYFDVSGNKIYYEENAIKQGYGLYYLYEKPTVYDDVLIKAQDEAKKNNVGIWKYCGGKRIPLDQMINQTKTKVDSIINNTSTGKTNTTKVPTTPNSTFSCKTVKNTCSQMKNCEEAKFYLNSCGKSKLDGNKDGVPCEALCK